MAYDANNNLTQRVTPRGVPSGTTVTCATNLSAITTAYATDSAYDAAGTQLLSATSRFTDPDTGLKTAITKYEYGDAANPGRVTRLIPPRGNTGGSPDYTYATMFSYFTSGSKAGLLQQRTDALGNATTYDYDPVGRLASSVDPLGNAVGGVPADHRTDYVYDNEDRMRFVKLPAPAAGGAQLVTETRYDEVGNPITRIDADRSGGDLRLRRADALFQVKESPNAWTDPASPPAGVFTTEYGTMPRGCWSASPGPRATPPTSGSPTTPTTAASSAHRETQYPAWPSTSGSLVTSSTHDPAGNPRRSSIRWGERRPTATTRSTAGLDRLLRCRNPDVVRLRRQWQPVIDGRWHRIEPMSTTKPTA